MKIQVDNFRKLLTESLGFERKADEVHDILYKYYEDIDVELSVNFTEEKLNYPIGVEANRDTTKNFSQAENAVVFECVASLFAKGYRPEHIILEKGMPGGHGDTGGYCDIIVQDNNKKPYLLIECKTRTGEKNDEFSKAWKRMQNDGGQLFNYYNSFRQAQYICLYASNFADGELYRQYHLIAMVDNDGTLSSNSKLKSFREVSANNEGRDEFFKVWKETYDGEYTTSGIFESDILTFGVGKRKLTSDDLEKDIDIDKKYHQFKSVLRQHNVSSHENAFDKLVNLILVKIVDETRNPQDLQFIWKGRAYDDYYSFQDRLQKLYQIGMSDYMHEDITYIDNEAIEKAFRLQRNDPDAIKDTIINYFRQLKFYSNSDFGFLDVHNELLFRQNSIILKEMVGVLQDMKMKTEEQNHLLGDLFEGFLDLGVKQDEGQFFTPMAIVRFMVSCLPLEMLIRDNADVPKAIDYACGAGHFLNEYAAQIKPLVEQYKGNDQLPEYYKGIYGVEKEYRLSKVSKVASFMYGQDGIEIVYGDALVEHEKIKDNSFKVLIANPPYSVTGFLETLTKEEREKFVLSDCVSTSSLPTFKEIETFFIERAKQLLAPGGVTAIIVPPNIINGKSAVDIKAREIMLKYFNIVSIVEYSGKTFGRTNTSTIALFLQKKEDNPELANHYEIRVNAWFENNHSQDERYEDLHLFEEYCERIEVDYYDYQTLICREPSDTLKETDYYKAYDTSFRNDTKAKQIKKKKITANYTAKNKSDELEKYVLDRIIEIEKEKLYYFMLASSNPQSVIVVKCPTTTAPAKKFLGYEWSSRKGHEGYKYLGVNLDDDESDLSYNKGLKEIDTPLFDPNNFQNEEKLNSLIRNNFLGKPYEIPEDLEEFVSVCSLPDMISFDKVDFNKIINTSVAYKVKFESKYPLEKLSKIVRINPSGTEIKNLPDDTMVSFVEMASVSENGYIETKVDRPLAEVRSGSYTYFANDDIILAKITPCMENGKCALASDLTNGIGYGSSEFHVFRCSEKIDKGYLFALLNRNDVRYCAQKSMTGKSGHRRVPESFYASMEIPVPEDKKIQAKIAAECAKVDEELLNMQEECNTCESEMSRIINSLQGNKSKIAVSCFLNQCKIDPTETPNKEFVYIDIDAVGNGTGIWRKDKTIIGKSAPSRARRYAHKDSVLISTVRPNLKGFAYIDEDLDNAVFSTGFAILESQDTNILLNKLLYYEFMYSNTLMEQMVNAMPKGQYPSINKDDINNLEIIVPDNISYQDSILNELNRYEKRLNDARKKIASSSARKQAIMDKYLK